MRKWNENVVSTISASRYKAPIFILFELQGQATPPPHERSWLHNLATLVKNECENLKPLFQDLLSGSELFNPSKSFAENPIYLLKFLIGPIYSSILLSLSLSLLVGLIILFKQLYRYVP